MKKAGIIIVISLITLFLVEGMLRVYNKQISQSWSTSQDNLLIAKYPILEKLASYEYEEGKKNILVLGGSVVFEDTTSFKLGEKSYQMSFCGLKQHDTTWNVLNLAFPGHTSLDSRIKMSLLGKYDFDYVFIYHGINDARSNNTLNENYDLYYKHIQFYDELWTLLKHQETRYTITPYYIELIFKRIKNKLGFRNYIPKEFLSFIVKEDIKLIEKYFNLPCIRPSIASFSRNLNAILEFSFTAGIQPILCTYAYFQPAQYDYTKFVSGQLDYASNLFPTELYGSPNCIPYAIEGHNKVITKLSKKHKGEVLYLDFEQVLPKLGENYMDICHLTPNSCHVLYRKLEEVLDLCVEN